MKNKFVVSIISLMGVGMIVKVLGFFRSLLIARQFGSGATTDAFFLALSLIGIFTSFFGGALGQTIVPILTEITYSEGQEAKDRHMSNIVNLFIVGSIAIIGFIWLLAPQIINLMAKDGFTASQVNLTVDLLRIGLPALLFYNITGLYKGYLHTEEIFVISEISNLPYNIIYILYLLALSSLFGIRGLMFAHGIAVFSMLILPIHTIKKRGYHHSLIFKPRDPYIIKSLNMILPVFMGIAINDLNIFIDQLMASRLAVGSISALNYGNRFNIIVQQIFVAALSTVIFPEISKAYQEKDHKSVTNIVQRGMNLVLLVVIPMTIAIMVLHVPVTRLLFERGEFTPLATQMTAKAMFFYSLGLPAASLKVLLLKLSYASMDMKLPLVNSILSLIFNVILNLVFIQFLDHGGLALATSMSSFITLLFFYWKLSSIGWKFNLKKNITLLVKTLISSAVMAIGILFMQYYLDPVFGKSFSQRFVQLALYMGVGLIVYTISLILLKTAETKEIKNLLKNKK